MRYVNSLEPEFLECKICHIKFEDMAERQVHMSSQHMEKGDFPTEKEIA